MTYELAKQLKDAGFPNSDVWIDNGNEGFFVDEGEIVHMVPTLSELIEACGLDLHRLERDTGKWRAYEQSGLNNLYSEGDTPEEAIARLWLALNRPTI